MRRTLHLLFIVAMMLAGTQMAKAQVQLSMSDHPYEEGYVVGDTVRFEIKADSSLTGLNALALTMRLTYNPNTLEAVGTSSSGTILGNAGWAVSPNISNPGELTMAAAGATALSDSGAVLFVDFKLKSRYTHYVYFDQNNTFFNESIDDIPIIYANTYGQVSVGAKPTINVSFPNTPFVIGDSLNASVSSAEAPISWSVTNPALAEVDTTGKVKAKGYGSVGIIAEDNRGIRDTVQINILGFRIAGADTTNFEGQEVSVPISVSDLTGLNVLSGEFKLNTTIANNIEVLSVDKGDMLDSGASVSYNTESDGIKVTFAQTSALSGAGTLFNLKLRLKKDRVFNNYSSFSSMLMNEEIEGTGNNFRIQSLALPALSITYASQSQYLVGDSLEFTALNNTGPVQWMVSDTSLASIDSNGLMTSKKGGSFTVTATDSIGATKTTNPFTFYDTVVEFPDSSMLISDTLYYPVRINNLENTSSELLSAEITFTYSQNQINYLGYSTSSAMMSGWSVSENQLSANQIKLVAAGANSISSSGDLIYLKFKADTSISSDRYTYLTINEVVLNEGTPNYVKDDGRIFISTKPLTPILDSPLNGAINISTDVTLDWNTAVGADNYAVQLSTSTSFTSNVLDTTGVVPTEIAVTGLDYDERYYWRVKALNSSGESSWSSYFYFDTQDPIPASPMLSSPADAATGLTRTPTLSWMSVTYAQNYRVEVSTQSDFSSIMVDSTIAYQSTSIRLDTLDYLTEYHWRVYASNTTGESAASASRNFTTIIEIPEIPQLLVPADALVKADTVQAFTWNTSARADEYTFELSDNVSFTNAVSVTTTDTVVTQSNLAYQTQYYWRVKASNDGGESGYSAANSFETRAETASVPALLLPAMSEQQVSLDPDFVWQESNAALTYRFQLATDVAFTTPISDQTGLTDTTATVAGLDYLTQYFWRVKAFGADDSTGWSATFDFTTLVESPETPVLLTPADASIDVGVDTLMTWNQAARADSFHVQISELSDFSSTLTDTVVTDTTFMPALNFETTYFWRVQSLNATGSSAWSTSFSLTTIEPTDLPPVILSPLSDVVLDEDFGTHTAAMLTDTFSDPEGGTLQFEIVSATNLVISSIQTDSLVLESVQDSSGSGDIIIKAMDMAGQEVRDTMTVTVNAVNDLPFVVSLPDTISYTNDQAFTLDLSTAFGDVEDSFADLNIAVTVDESSVSASVTTTDSLKLMPTTFSGFTTLNFAVEDSDGGMLDVSVVLEVKMATSNEVDGSAPITFNLEQNYPNPFNPSSTIRFGVPTASEVRLDVYNMLGQHIATLVNGKMQAGWHTVQFDAAGLSTGTYIYRIVAGDFVQTRKMMLIK